jgi:glutamyl endopeptidase
MARPTERDATQKARGQKRSRIPRGVKALKSFALDRSTYPSLPNDNADTLGIRTALRTEEAQPGLLLTRSHMVETFGGGSLEAVPHYDASRAMTGGIAFGGDVFWSQLSPVDARTGLERSGTESKPESVIGREDTRRAVANTTVIPWRCVAHLRTEYTDSFVGRGTGWFIAPRTLVTAAHNVHDRDHGRARRIVVTPGFHRGAAPFRQALVSSVDLHPSWSKSFARELDFALLFIPQTLGVGYFGFAAGSDSGLRNVLVNIAGYPIDRPDSQMYDAGRVTDVDADFIYHTIDTESGQSGAPVFWSDRESRIGLGIHTYGASSVDRTNVARRITAELYEQFVQRKR